MSSVYSNLKHKLLLAPHNLWRFYCLFVSTCFSLSLKCPHMRMLISTQLKKQGDCLQMSRTLSLYSVLYSPCRSFLQIPANLTSLDFDSVLATQKKWQDLFWPLSCTVACKLVLFGVFCVLFCFFLLSGITVLYCLLDIVWKFLF